MTYWLDDSPYPLQLPIARELRDRLVDTYFEPLEIRELVRSAGAPVWTKIKFDTGPYYVWAATLDRAAAEGALRTLLKYILDEAKPPKPVETFIRDLLDGVEGCVNARPGDGQQPVVGEASREEALLFGDDLSESVGEIADLVASIGRVMEKRSAVCRLEVTDKVGDVRYGTGTLLSSGRVLTNHHVLVPGGVNAVAVSVEWNLERDAQGQMVPSIKLAGDVATIRADAADDWGVIGVPGVPNMIAAVDLATSYAEAVATHRTFILQHPDGNPKRLAFVRNRISSVEARRVFYVTDTKPGSSGSPVFDGQGKLVALHRAGGTPIKYIGATPVKRNEGVRMDVIAAAILAL